MLSNRLAFAALAIACIGAAAGGGYLASRQNAMPAPASAQVQSIPSASPSAAAEHSTPPQPVQETEAVVGDTAPRSAAAKGTNAKRLEAPIRSAAPRQARAASRPQDAAPSLTSSWPSGNSAPPQALPAPAPPPAADQPPLPRVDDRPTPEARPAEPPQRMIEELVVSAQTVIGLQTETRVTSETARVEDRVDARVTRDVRVGDRIAIPAGSRAIGSVMQVERGGKFKERARLGIRFHTLVLADGTRVPITTETIFRDGEAPGDKSAAKVGGGAVVGTILGAILGGGKGAAIGAAAGAGGGAAATVAGDRNAATLPAGTPMTVRILQPVTITTDKD
jgi:hypothetical protein